MHHLSLQQKAAIQHLKGPLLILGGAGSGKTSLLACKIAWLIREHHVAPGAIVALAATAASVQTLRRQVTRVLGRRIPALDAATFVEFGLRTVQQAPETVGLRPGFSVYDRRDSEALVAQLLAEEEPAAALAPAVWRCIAAWKRAAAVPRVRQAREPEADAALRLYDAYHRRLHAANALDLEDLARKALEAHLNDDALLSNWRRRVRYLLLDEYERASADAHELVRLLAQHGAVVTAAADDRLAGAPATWGAGASAVRLPSDLPDLRVIRLEENFRSRPGIITLAERLAAPGGPRSPSPALADSAANPARVLRGRSEQQEAEVLVALLHEHQRRAGGDYSHYAILLRRAALAAPIEHALRTHRVPYYTRGISSFFEQTEIRDLRAYLRLLCNPADNAAFLCAIDTPRRNLERSALAHLAAVARARGRSLFECALDACTPASSAARELAPLRELADLIVRLRQRAEAGDAVGAARALLEELRYEEWLRDSCNDITIAARRMDNVTRLIDLLARLQRERPEAGLRALMARLDLEAVRDPEAEEGAGEGVALMTLAAARGMEFHHVCLVGFELPPGAAEPPDERYWAYVGVTRAKESVLFTLAEHRRTGGAITARQPSGFLAELPVQELGWTSPGGRSAPLGPAFVHREPGEPRSRA